MQPFHFVRYFDLYPDEENDRGRWSPELDFRYRAFLQYLTALEGLMTSNSLTMPESTQVAARDIYHFLTSRDPVRPNNYVIIEEHLFPYGVRLEATDIVIIRDRALEGTATVNITPGLRIPSSTYITQLIGRNRLNAINIPIIGNTGEVDHRNVPITLTPLQEARLARRELATNIDYFSPARRDVDSDDNHSMLNRVRNERERRERRARQHKQEGKDFWKDHDYSGRKRGPDDDDSNPRSMRPRLG